MTIAMGPPLIQRPIIGYRLLRRLIIGGPFANPNSYIRNRSKYYRYSTQFMERTHVIGWGFMIFGIFVLFTPISWTGISNSVAIINFVFPFMFGTLFLIGGFFILYRFLVIAVVTSWFDIPEKCSF